MSKLEGLTLQQRRDVIGQFYKANIDQGKSYTVKHFLKMGVPRATIYRACASMERNYTTKRKPGSGRPAVKITKRKETQLWYPGGQRLKVISFSRFGVKSPSTCFSYTEPTTIIASRDEKPDNTSLQ